MADNEPATPVEGRIPDKMAQVIGRRSHERWAAALETFKLTKTDDLPPPLLRAMGAPRDGRDRSLPATAFFEALEQMPLPITITDADSTVLYVNKAFETLTDYSLEDLIGQQQSINSHRKTPIAVYKKMWDTILSGKVWNGRLLNRRKNGDAYVVDLTITPIRAEDGEVLYFVGIHTDATEVHELERKFSNQKALIESVINLAPVIMALIDTEGNVIVDNLAYKTFAGDLGSEPADHFLRALKNEIGEDLNAACQENRTFSNIEVSFDMGGGRAPRWFSCSGNWVKEFDVRPDNYFMRRTKNALLIVCNDISIQRMEYQRAKYSAMRAMMVEQQMAQRIQEIFSAAIFQLQGPLNVINAMSGMLQRQHQTDSPIGAALTQVLQSGEMAIKTLENAIPDLVEEPRTIINVNELLREVLIVSMERMTAFDVSLDWCPYPDALTVHGQTNALRNLFKNLIDNAIDAIEQSSDSKRMVRIISTLNGDGFAEINIENSGPVMTREVRSRAFEPFFSGWTKARGRSGMGLAIARQIASDNDGSIEIDDRFQSGCRIRVFLPALGREQHSARLVEQGEETG